jgi:hypothetical protein
VTRRPDLFIIGAAKCGTTSVYEYLKGHPEVFMSPAKEPRYFAPDLASAGTGHDLRYGVDEDRYLGLFAEARAEKRLGEASVRYIYSRQAPALIRDFQPRPYIIAMLRNPVDVVHSMHNQRWSEGAEEIADFEQALAAEEDRKAGRGIPPGSSPMLAVYRDRARFGEQLPRWFETFERERIHVIIFEDMVRDPAGTFRRVLEFLEIDPDYQPESFAVHNPRHQPRNMFLRSLLNSRLPQWFVWSVMPQLLGDRVTRGLVRRFRHSRLNRKPAAKTTMRPETRRQLEDEFAPDVAVLSKLLDRDLAALWWNRQPETAPEGAPAALCR